MLSYSDMNILPCQLSSLFYPGAFYEIAVGLWRRRASLVITRGHSNLSHIAFAIDITIRLGVGHDAAAGSDEARGAVYRPTSRIVT